LDGKNKHLEMTESATLGTAVAANRRFMKNVPWPRETQEIVTIRAVCVEDAACLKALRLAALRESPVAFGLCEDGAGAAVSQ